MDFQTAFNVALTAAGFLGGWVITTMWQAIRDMQTADKNLAEKVSSIEVLVAGKYVTREEYRGDIADIKDGIKRIYDKMDTKADRRP